MPPTPSMVPMRIGSDRASPPGAGNGSGGGIFSRTQFQPLDSNNKGVTYRRCSCPTNSLGGWTRLLVLMGVVGAVVMLLFYLTGPVSSSSSSSPDSTPSYTDTSKEFTSNDEDDVDEDDNEDDVDEDDNVDNITPDDDAVNPSPTDFDSKVAVAMEFLQDYYSNRNLVLAGFGGLKNPQAVDKLIETLAVKISQAFTQKRPFVIAAVGSTWIAGYGNCKSERYLALMYETLNPLFVAGGSRLEVQEHPIGFWCGMSPIAALSELLNPKPQFPVDELHFAFPTEEIGLDQANIDRHRVFLAQMFGNDQTHKIVLESSCGKEQSTNNNNNNAILCINTILDHLSLRNRGWGAVSSSPFDKTRKGTSKSGVLFRNWRPGPLSHQIIADTFIMLHLMAIKRAIKLQSKVPPPSPSLAVTNNNAMVISPLIRNGAQVKDGWQIIDHGPMPSLDEVPIRQQTNTMCVYGDIMKDACPGYFQSSTTTSPLIVTFSVPSHVKSATAYLCCCCNGALCVREQFGNPKFVSITVDGKQVMDRGKTDVRLEECLMLNDALNAGEHRIEVTPNSGHNKEIRVSRVLILF